MAKRTGTTEQTSSSVASLAGKMLNSATLHEAETWLVNLALTDTAASDHDRTQATVLLGALHSLRSLAASALTQR